MKQAFLLGGTLITVLAACTSSTTRRHSQAMAELSLSTSEQQEGNYRAALEHARKAVELGPEIVGAHLAAATIAKDLCIPNAQPGPNMDICGPALAEYKRVLQMDPSNKEASIELAYLLWQFGRAEGSETYYRRALALDPNDPEALAAVAAIGASRSWKEIMNAGVPAGKPLIDFSACAAIRQNNIARVDEGISLLTKANQREREHNHVEFTSWMSQLYRIRAEMQCGNPAAYRKDISEARKWDLLGSASRKTGARHSVNRYPPSPPPGIQ